MSQLAATCEVSRPTFPCLRQTSESPAERADCRIGERGPAGWRPSSTLLELPSAPLRTFAIVDERTDHRTAAQLFLIADDSGLLLGQLRRLFPAPIHRVQVASTGNLGLEHIGASAPDVIVLDLCRSDQSGLKVLEQIRGLNACIPVVVVSQSGGADAAIEAMKQGAHDCLFKPLDPNELRRVVGDALDAAKRMREPVVVAEPAPDTSVDGAIVGACPAMREVYKAIGRVAGHNVPVLITGASGTGKELVARAIYEHSARAKAPYLALNCAAIPENLLESEVFGHEKGAFTGADRKRIGKFEQCNGGTIFLDEIGDMPLSLQAKILRLLQDQTFERVGGNETIHTDVRLIAATNRDLKALSAEGNFRPDLYYRLGVFTIHLPPLRERGDDLLLLVRHYLRRFNRELSRDIREVAPEALERLRTYSWPGNIRELESVLKQALLQASGTALLPAFLPDRLGSQSELLPARSGEEPGPEAFVLRPQLGTEVRDLYAETHRHLDRLLMPRVLEYTRGNLQQAAHLLGIARQTLRLKLRDLGLSVIRAAEAEEE
jgi:DNA-binding NtrC family response regulator